MIRTAKIATTIPLMLLLLSSSSWAKDYKSGEFETTKRYGFGAFEARIRAAKGPGAISTFFLWKPGSETAPAVPWEEIDFELGPSAGAYQTQIMTPGSNPPMFRTEHTAAHDLPSQPWDAYYTYRMEWTPTYIAFFRDGLEVRRETDQNEFAALFATDASGNVPIDQRMEVRTGVWPGGPNIASWSGVFDGKNVPTAHFVDYVKVWAYTPNQANQFATLLLDDEFDTLNLNNWYPAQWTFEFSVSDYVPQNIGARSGKLVVALTTNAGQSILPDPPSDTPPPNTLVIQAEDYDAFSDTTSGNFGDAACSSTDVDAQYTSDTNGGNCNIGWTAAGEWLDYHMEIAQNGTYDIAVRLASQATNNQLHVEFDGLDISGPISGPGNGWQTFSDAIISGVSLSAGAHVVRLAFDFGELNVNYLVFRQLDQTTGGDLCQVSCDDGNPCTTDSCDSVKGCQFHNTTAACADDGDACTNDICQAGNCTHPANGSCSGGAAPCSGLCSNPLTFNSSNFSSGNLGISAVCYQTTANLSGGVCGNLAAGRMFTVNGVKMACIGNWPRPLPARLNGGYCMQASAGDFAWAYFVTW